MNINWLYVGLAALAVYGAIFGFHVSRGAWTRSGLFVGIANMAFVILNLVAPFRGVLDPNYAGYRMGLLEVAPGIWVTLISGLIVAGALAAACVAVRNFEGRPLLVLIAVDLALLILIGLPEAFAAISNPEAFAIHLGEYLQINGWVAASVVTLIFAAPLTYSTVWGVRRLRMRAA